MKAYGQMGWQIMLMMGSLFPSSPVQSSPARYVGVCRLLLPGRTGSWSSGPSAGSPAHHLHAALIPQAPIRDAGDNLNWNALSPVRVLSSEKLPFVCECRDRHSDTAQLSAGIRTPATRPSLPASSIEPNLMLARRPNPPARIPPSTGASAA